MCVIVSIFDCVQRETPGFPQRGIKTPCIIPGFLLLLSHRCFCNPHTLAYTLSAPRVFWEFSIYEHFCVRVYVCVCMRICCLHMCCVCTCLRLSWVCIRVPSLLACLTGSDTSVAFPGESGPVPNCQEINATDSALLLSPHIPPSPSSSVCPPLLLSLSWSVSLFSLLFSPSVLLRALIKNGVSVCCIFKMVMDGFKRLMVFSVSSGSCYEPLS